MRQREKVTTKMQDITPIITIVLNVNGLEIDFFILAMYLIYTIVYS